MKEVGALTGLHGVGDAETPEQDPPPDSALWSRAARGDETAFTELFHRHAEAVWNHAYRLTGSWATAEDIASATFVTAWRKCAEITLVNDSARPWLYTVAANLARSHSRGERRRIRFLRTVGHRDVAPDHAESVADRLYDEELVHRTVAAIAALPRSQREAAELCLIGELPVADAAAVLGVAEATVRSHISRARARLRTILEEK